MKRALTGIRPSGDLHLGNYLGTIKPALELTSDHECFYFIADLHSLTTLKDPKLLKRYTYEITAAFVALGLDTKKHLIYRQSDLPQVTELTWYLSCVTGFGFVEKAHAYKDATANSREVNVGVFSYPLLMASDILLYDADVVPVGKDQKQHVEMARDMAGSLNAIYGEVLKLPKPLIREEVMTVPGLDGRKMSKSYDNVIPIFSTEKELRKKVMSIVTDSTPVEDPKSLKEILLGELFSIIATKAQYNDLESRLQKGGLGWGHAKEELFVLMNEMLSEPRKRYDELVKDTMILDKILDDGATRAYVVGGKVLKRVREAMGFR